MVAANPPIGRLAPAVPRPLFGLEYKWLVLIAILPGFTVFLLDVTIVNVALARLGSVFEVNYATVQWVITGYSLASGMATPMASYLEMRFTMKRVWVARASGLHRVVGVVRPGARLLGAGRRPRRPGLRRRHDAADGHRHHLRSLPAQRARPGHGLLRHPDGRRPGARSDHRRLHRHQLGLAAGLLRQPADRHCRRRPELARPASRQAQTGYSVRHARARFCRRPASG